MRLAGGLGVIVAGRRVDHGLEFDDSALRIGATRGGYAEEFVEFLLGFIISIVLVLRSL